jgi:signal transduction histidine kinase
MTWPRLGDLSIRAKILTLVMLITTVALLLASGSLLLWSYFQFRADLERELSAEARLVLENSVAAISFQDRDAARDTLQTLARNQHVRAACLYSAADALFVEFRTARATRQCPPTAPAEGFRFGSGLLEVTAHTQVSGSPAGSVFVESDLEAVSGRVRVQLLTGAAVLGVSLIVAFVLSTVLHRIISEPIDALVRTAGEVSTRGDYSLRAAKTTGDELGVLVDAFNGMLGHIEQAEHERAGLLAREREANRLKDEFLMTLSHELRTPLNAILGWTRMLISGVVPAAEVERALAKIERNAQSQARLVEDLLEVSRFTTGKFRIERARVDLVAIANQAIETIRPEAESRRITLERQFEITAAPLVGDFDRLQQVIWNLLSNAIKFSPYDSRIVIAIRGIDDRFEMRVQDSGVGIDPAFRPYVFEPFRQADASSTRTHAGLGLGLAIVRRIVELHGGQVTAESAGVGRGATFVVRLPAAPADAAAADSRTPTRRANRSDLEGLRILVVDDDADTRDLVATVLGGAGARIFQASDAGDALTMARDVVPDVLISDIAMPERDGFMLLADLRRMFGRTAPRIAVALTAQATAADRERALGAGFDCHIPKPFDPLALVDLLREVMAGSR